MHISICELIRNARANAGIDVSTIVLRTQNPVRETAACLQGNIYLAQRPTLVGSNGGSKQEAPHPRATGGRTDNKYPHDRYDDKYLRQSQYTEDAKTLAAQFSVSECSRLKLFRS